MQTTWVRPHTAEATKLADLLAQPLTREYRLIDLLRRPNITYATLMQHLELPITDLPAAEQVEIQAKYAGYIERQTAEIAKSLRQETLKIPAQFDYSNIVGLSHEVRQKLATAKPATVGHASRIPGITPAAVSLLLVHLKKRKASGA